MKQFQECFNKVSEVNDKLHLNLTDTQISLITKHLLFVIETNKLINLTAIESIDDGVVKHIEDSLVLLDDINRAPEGMYADIGTGGGYPGVPISVASGRPTKLFDGTAKKILALNNFASQNGLEGLLEGIPKRAEEFSADNPQMFAVVTARALSSLPVIIELASPLLIEGGLLVATKGKPEQEEIDRSLKAADLCGMDLAYQRSVFVGGIYERTIFVYKKIGEPKVILPRRNGVAQKKPLA